tara:strand:- start:5197 stop:7527 length:2331 start_codon:yes stop_codon:yes gene_type:complete
MDEQKIYLFGNAEVYYENISLKAAQLIIDLDSNIVTAKGVIDSSGNYIGKPEFADGPQTFTAHSIRYNFDTKKGKIKDVVTQDGEGYIHGKEVKRLPSEVVYIKNGKFTTCNLEEPHFYFNASKLKVIPDDKIVSGPANLVIEGIPTPLGVPFGIFPNKKGHKSGIIIPQPGESTTQGFFLINGGYYWAINEKLALQLTGDIYSKGSWGSKLYAPYRVRYRYSGNMNLSFSNITNSYKEFPDYSVKREFFVRWQHNQDAAARPNSRFTANINFGTATNFQNNFNTNTNDYLSNTFNSNVSYYKKFANSPFSLSLNGRHSQNNKTHNVSISLPEVALTATRVFPFKRKQNIGQPKWYEKIGVSYTMNAKNEINIADSLLVINDLENVFYRYSKNGIKHNIPISTSLKLMKYFTLTPSVNYTELWYFNSINKTVDSQNQVITDTIQAFSTARKFNSGMRLTTKLYGTYRFKNKKLPAVRHVITPSIGFTYSPEINTGLKQYSDTSGNEISYSIYQTGIYGRPDTKKTEALTFNILNNIEMKVKSKKDTLKGEKKIKLLENLGISGSYNFAADSMNLSTIKVNGRTRFTKTTAFTFNATLDPYAINNSTRINLLEWEKTQSLGRLTNANAALVLQLKSKKKNKKISNLNNNDTDNPLKEYVKEHPEEFIDYTIPWTLNISYNVNYSKPLLKETITQTLNFNGDVSLTPKWKLGFTSGYDFIQNDISYTSIDIYRDLHCWEMRVNVIPFGPRQSYIFTLQVKASMLQDLKITKRSLPNIF